MHKFSDDIVNTIMKNGGRLKGQLKGKGKRLFWPADFDHSELMTHWNGNLVLKALKTVFSSDSSVGWFSKWAYILTEPGAKDQGVFI